MNFETVFVLFLQIIYLIKCESLDFNYHNYALMTSYLQKYAMNNSDLTELFSIGKSVRKRQLWVMKISAIEGDTMLIPNIKLLANIHGNEAAGREILLHFIPYLVKSYREGDENIRHILSNNIIHILPSLNPDGFEKSREGCQGPGRENTKDVDLNRSFPDFFRRNSIPKQPETDAVMKWMNKTKFILSASLHGGAMVANYPFESTKEDLFSEAPENKSPDDDVFQKLAMVYANAHPTMHLGKSCEESDNETKFENGITNGAAWYSLIGGMQDYNYAFHGCMELTLEVSCCKYPRASQLEEIWHNNTKALTEYCLLAGMGVKGLIIDAETKKPIVGAKLLVEGRNMTFYTSPKGEFYRILLPGQYILRVQAESYKTKKVSFVVEEQGRFKSMTLLNIELEFGDDSEEVTAKAETTEMINDNTVTYKTEKKTTTERVFLPVSPELIQDLASHYYAKEVRSANNGHMNYFSWFLYVFMLFSWILRLR